MLIKHNTRLISLSRFSWVKFRGLAVIGAVMVLGYVVVRSFAAGPMAAFEPETGALAGGATPQTITGASGSGVVKFTAAATPTPTPTAGGCIGAANTPGGPDPWGTCWPGPHNTGYPHGLAGDTRTPVTLTNVPGSVTSGMGWTWNAADQEIKVTGCGGVIDGMKINGSITITAGNGTHSPNTPCVTIKNSFINGGDIHTDTGGTGPVVISDTEVLSTPTSWWASIGFYNTFTYRVNSRGGQGTIKCADYCESYDSWVHGMDLNLSYHYNAFGGNGIEKTDGYFKIVHAYAACGDFATKRPEATADAGCSADIGFYGDFAPIHDITIDKTFFYGYHTNATFDEQSQPGYCLNPGYYPGKPYPNVSNIIVTNNVFARAQTNKCGAYGDTNTWQAGSGNVWSNNKYDDGTMITVQ